MTDWVVPSVIFYTRILPSVTDIVAAKSKSFFVVSFVN